MKVVQIEATNPFNGKVHRMGTKVDYTHAVVVKVSVVKDFKQTSQVWFKGHPGEGWVFSHMDEQGKGFFEKVETRKVGEVFGHWERSADFTKVEWVECCYVSSHHKGVAAAEREAKNKAAKWAKLYKGALVCEAKVVPVVKVP